MKDETWRPTTTHGVLKQRAQVMARVRSFFAARGVLEVDTSMVVNAPVTDVHIHSAEVRFTDSDVNESASVQSAQAAGNVSVDGGARDTPRRYFLHTSPEFAMKRLLAAGSGDIYQICHVVRGLERGRHHNAEFALIEWYRGGFSLEALMDEVEALARHVLGARAATMQSERVTYRDVFLRELQIDPLTCTYEALVRAARELGFDTGALGFSPAMLPATAGSQTHSSSAAAPAGALRDELLDLLMGATVGPRLGRNALTFVHRYPASQAALARLDPADPRCALRFELYCEGVELANGFHELASPQEQRARFQQDLLERQRRGLPTHSMDENLLGALENGLPDAAGVALGFDRLLMLAVGASHIDEVIAFPIERS